jgi:hypothetical protein
VAKCSHPERRNCRQHTAVERRLEKSARRFILHCCAAGENDCFRAEELNGRNERVGEHWTENLGSPAGAINAPAVLLAASAISTGMFGGGYTPSRPQKTEQF